MAYENAQTEEIQNLEPRPVAPALSRGIRGRCPNCGEGSIFAGGLKVTDACNSCGEDLHHHRADDLPAYLNIFIVGHIVVAATMLVLDAKVLGLWPLVTLSALSAVLLSIVLMRPLKGLVVAAQWAMRMHGFGGHED